MGFLLLQILLIGKCLHIVSSSCKSHLPPLTEWNTPEKCCPPQFNDICCPSIPRCSKESKILWAPAKCVDPKDIDCQPGFVSDQNGTILAAPGGLFSPAGLRCAIPCVYGSFCPETFLHRPSNLTTVQCTQLSKCCKYSDGKIADVRAALAGNGSLLCPGASKWTVCPSSYFCPDPSNRTECSQSSLCPKGLTRPLECNLLHECARGGGYVDRWAALLFLIILLIFSFAVYTGFQNRREIKRYFFKLFNMIGKNDPASNAIKYGLTNLALKPLTETGDNVMGRIDQPIDITFNNLNYETNERHILDNVFGTFEHGKITAIMGPSGCGKTTIMNILRGKLRKNVTGNISWNDEPLHELTNYKSVIGYAPQEDIMHSQLTVKEVLMYRANITCASWKSSQEKREYVQNLMGVLGLSAIADSLVGGDEERGISGGQKRRLNVGMELVGNPTILFCDEPTSGLDSSTSLELIRTLRNIAETSGINIICVIHQPRYECFALFHRLLLLSSQGKVVYQGGANEAQGYFESLGFATVPQSNPADFIIDIANGTKVSNECSSTDLPYLWMDKYRNEELAKRRKNWAARRASSNTTLVAVENRKAEFTFAPPPKPSRLMQFFWLFKREILLQIRNASQFLMEIVITLLIGGLLGGMYTKPDIRNQIGKLAMASLCIGILTVIMAMKFIGNNWNNVLRESGGGISILSYYLAVNLISSPVVVVVLPLSFLAIYHTVSDTRSSFTEHYTNLVCTMFAASGYGLLVSCAVPCRKMYMVAVGVVLMLVFSGGSCMSLCDMSKVSLFGPVLYSCSFARWFIEAQYESEVKYYSDAEAWAVQYYAKRNLYTLDNRMTCLSALIAMGVVTRLLGFIAIVFRTR